MKQLSVFIAFTLAVLVATTSIARADKIAVANNADDAWVWVTIINGRNLDAWCVNPKSLVRKEYGDIVAKVRVEVTARAGCAHPVMLDRTLENWVPVPGTNQVRHVGTYYVDGHGGAYTFGHN